MSGNSDNTTCAALGGDLVAFAYGQLDGEAAARVEKHLAGCAACASELEEIRAVRSDFASIPAVPVSGSFHDTLMSRARKVKFDRATPIGELASVGPASRRFVAMAERDRPVVKWLTPRLKVVTLALSAAAAVLFVIASQFVKIETPVPSNDRVVHVPRQDGRATVARWRQRRECPDLFPASAMGGELDLSNIVEDGDLMMTASYDVSQHEKCVLLFSSASWETMRAEFAASPAGIEKRRFQRLAASVRAVKVASGRLTVPAQLLTDILDGGTDLIILKLPDRMEIWSREAYGTHTRELPSITVDMNDISMAPAVLPRRFS